MVVCAIGTTDDDSIQMPVGIPNLECAMIGSHIPAPNYVACLLREI